MTRDKILLVDDDPTVLRSYKRNLSLEFDIDTAVGGPQGLELCDQNGHYAVIVSDMRMPVMDGTKFLAEVRKRWPSSVRMLLTGQADMRDAIAVINEGQIFRFLTKPCPPDYFAQALKDGIRQYRLITAEKELLGKTLRGSIKLLLDVLSIVNPEVFSQSVRARKLANQIGRHLGLENIWQIDLAALLAQIGYVTIPPEILHKKYNMMSLNKKERMIFAKHLRVGEDLLANIPRLEKVAEAIAYQEKHFDGGGTPADSRKGKAIPVIARILKPVHDFDLYVTQGSTADEALAQLQNDFQRYDPEILKALQAVQAEAGSRFFIREISPRQLLPGMVVANAVRTKGNILLIAKGQEVSETMRLCIWNFAEQDNVSGPIKIIETPSP